MKKVIGMFVLLLGTFVIISGAPGCKSKPKDEDLRTSVESALRANPQTSGVTATVQDRVVTLSGEAQDDAAKAKAGELAGAVKGVESVQNNISIAAPVQTPASVEVTADDPLTAAVRDATKDHPTVTATVNDGVITLGGEIKESAWKKLKPALDGLRPKRVDAKGLKISK